ncbi:MAG: conjugal transfer protein TraG N-terminal domain-containing protein [Pseudomonadota bacterium]
METFEIYTLGSGYYLEKIFNAINLILHPDNNFVSVMKLSALGAIVVLTVRAGLNSDFKSAAKWFFGVTILVGLFLTSKANVQIIDTLPDSYGRLSSARQVQSVPWGLAFIGSATSRIGNNIAQKFDQALAGVFNNSDYQQTGLLFGSKIVEDTSKFRIEDAGIKQLMLSFYKKCIVPDLNMGYKRANGYSLKDLTSSINILEFLKDHSSKARIIYVGGKPGGYQSCQKTAEYLYTSLNKSVDLRIPILAKQFGAFFSQNQGDNSNEASQVFASVLEGSYGIFLKNSSKNAKDILLQNIAINSLGEAADSKLYGKVATESMTKLAYNSVGQMAQKFIPILRAVLECLFYGVFPLVLILMVTPIGLDVLKNYAFGFIYLQLWQPMYAILFCIASSWGKLYASNITDITFDSHSSIMQINEEISSVSGYMLTLVPVLSLFITKGMVANMGNLASSIIYIPQSTAVQNAEAAVKGNYQIGNTSIDAHHANTSSSNKYDDNYAWTSGMKSFSMNSGAQERIYSDGRSTIDSSGAVSNLAGLAKIDWSKAIGNRYDQSINDNISNSERHASNMIENTSSGYSKLLGYDQNFSKGSSTYENWNKSLSSDQRKTIDEARGFVEKVAHDNNISTQDAMKVAVTANAEAGGSLFGIGGKLGINFEGSKLSSKTEGYNKMLETSKNENFAKSLSQIESFTNTSSYQENNNVNNNMLEGAKSDFNQAKSASYERSKSLDQVHNLQKSKADFESNSSSISQDLSNQFAQHYIKKFGAEKFENIIRTDPAQTNQLLNDFLNNRINVGVSSISNEFARDEASMQTSNIEDNHQKNSKIIENNNVDNRARVNSEAPTNFKGKVQNKITMESFKQNEVEHRLSDTSTELALSDGNIQSKGHKLKDEVEKNGK